jgi:hypothetical protein
VSGGLEILADHQLVEEQVLDGMSVRQAVGLLAGLSRDQAEAVALRVIAGLDTPDVATILGKSAGAVRVALHRGLKTLASDPSVRALAVDATGSAAPRHAAPGHAAPAQRTGDMRSAGPTHPASPRAPGYTTLEEVD